MPIHARRHADSWDHATTMLDVMGAIASPRCLEVFLAVLRVSRTVTELADDLGLETSRVSQCLGALSDAGLLRYRQNGRRHEYEPSPNVSMAVNDNRVALRLRGSRGSTVVLEPTPEELADLVRDDRRAAVPFGPIPRPAPVEMPIPHVQTLRSSRATG